MIIKSFEVEKIKSIKNNLILLYGSNQGHKNQVIKELFEKLFDGEISRLDENEILNNYEEFISSLINKSLFEDDKLIVISRISEKIIKLVNEILDRNIEKIKIIINSDNLEKKSKLRNLFEKEKELICIPFYEDNDKSLLSIVTNFLNEHKIQISREAINLIINRSSGDRQNLKQELDKILNYSITNKKISYENIEKLSNLSENYDVNELVNNYLAKNTRNVAKIFNENNYSNEDCILILRTLLNKSKKLMNIIERYKEANNLDHVISTTKPPIFWKA